MKTMLLAVLIFLLLLTPTFVNVPEVSATTTEDLRRVTPALPDDVPCEPMPENYTTEDYLDTTNPYSQVNPLGEETDEEGSHPLYVLVFGDEEERDVIRADPSNPVLWDGYARLQLERGDESLVANFGIDIRILGFLEWDSDDSIEYMTDPDEWDLCDELLADKGHYLRTWYDGEWWSNYVDAIVGITAQSTPADDPPTAGVAPSPNEKDQGTIFVLLKWQVYWQDDNLVQHEVSHLYYADDHPGPQPPAPCCAMAYHTHYQTFIYEDLLWMVFNDVQCAYTAYSWCIGCCGVIQEKSARYGAVCAMKPTFAYPQMNYIPDLSVNKMKIELLFDTNDLDGDQAGGESPYSSIDYWPDGHVFLADLDLMGKAWFTEEGDENWEYMADIDADGTVYLGDLDILGRNWNKHGTYSTDLTDIKARFALANETWISLALDDYGFVSIPEDAVGWQVIYVPFLLFPIGALVTFWN